MENAFVSTETKLWNGAAFSLPMSEEPDPQREIVTVSFIARSGAGLPAVVAND